MGSYKGDPYEKTELGYFNAMIDGALSGTINYFDTSINFRYQKSERLLGKVLRYLINNHNLSREELILGSKGGFL